MIEKIYKEDTLESDSQSSIQETIEELISIMWIRCNICKEFLFIDFVFCPYCGTKRSM